VLDKDHMGPGTPDKLGDPGPTWKLSFVFIYDIWKCKSQKMEKAYFFSNWNDSKNIWSRNGWE